MSAETKQKASYIAEYIIGAGYLLFLCLAFGLCSTVYYFAYLQPKPAPVNLFATSLPPTTPSPSIPSNYGSGAINIFKENFDDDRNSWISDQESSAYEFRDGKLIIESLDDNSYVLATCAKCPYLNEPYYLQVELSTDKLVDKGFGVVFKLLYTRKNFYLFEINPAAKTYFLYHRFNEDWSLRLSGRAHQIQSYPAINRLGIYVNKGLLEFYINGELVDTYQDSGTSFQSGENGFYVDGAGFKLIVDNFIVDKAGGK